MPTKSNNDFLLYLCRNLYINMLVFFPMLVFIQIPGVGNTDSTLVTLNLVSCFLMIVFLSCAVRNLPLVVWAACSHIDV